MGRGSIRAWIGVAAFAVSSISNAQGIRLTVQPVWSGITSYDATPYYANIENFGRNEEGVLTASSPESPSNLTYPVELPSGSKKRVLFTNGGFGDGKVYLRTSSGIKDATIKTNYGSEESKYGLISDNPSDLIFMKNQGSDQSGSAIVGVGGCIPDDAPSRSFGYDCLDALVLGDGTEKLRDEQILAIKRYVQQGGVLLFIGGAAPSASSDPRWKDIIPVSNSTVVTSNGLSQRIGTLQSGTIKINLKRGNCVTKSYGLGLVSLLSVNPFESPIREFEERRALVSRSMPRTHHKRISNLLQQQVGINEYSSRYGMGYASPSTSAAVYSPTGAPVPVATTKSGMPFAREESQDPFQIKPPSVSNIMWILIAYAIFVVPINFLVLRKINRLEIAWISTPVISVLFSLVLLNSTFGLYKSTATTRTTSIAILGTGNAESVVFGKSEMFFPRAKSTDLQLSNVESLVSTGQYSEPNSGSLAFVDDGRQILAPEVTTGNLAFKEIAYVQTSANLAGLDISLETSNGIPMVRLRNQSHANLSGITLYGPGAERLIKKPLPIGANILEPISNLVKSVATKKEDDAKSAWQSLANAVPTKLVVLATADTMRVGPKYGDGHPASRYMVVAVPQWRNPN